MELLNASEIAEQAKGEAKQYPAKEAKLREEFARREAELLKRIDEAADERSLQMAVSQTMSAGPELAFEQLVGSCVQFVQYVDADVWPRVCPASLAAASPSKVGAAGADPTVVVEAIQTAFRILQGGGAEVRLNQAKLMRRQSLSLLPTGSSGSPFGAAVTASPKRQDPGAAAPPPPKAGTLPVATTTPQAATPNVATDDDFPEAAGDKKDKKDKKKKVKKPKSKGGQEEAIIAALLPESTVVEALSSWCFLAGEGAAATALAKETINHLLDQQRQLVYEQIKKKFVEADASEVVKSPSDILELTQALAQVTDELQRTGALLAKNKQASLKIKEIADKRLEEVDKHKSHVEALREELAAQHSRHAAEQALQIDELIMQQNKKTEQLIAKQTKALGKEKKLRDELSRRISELEDQKEKLEQEYETKIMEYEALQDNYESAKIEHLKKLRELSQGASTYPSAGGLHAADSQAERLRAAVAKTMANAPNFGGVNTTFNPRANDSRVLARSAPEGYGSVSASAEGTLPMLGAMSPSAAGPRAPAGIAPTSTFSRNFLDVPRA